MAMRGMCDVFGIGVEDRAISRAPISRILVAQRIAGGRVPFEHGERVRGLRAGDDLEALLF